MNTSAKFMMLRGMKILKSLSDNEITLMASQCTYEKSSRNSYIYQSGSKPEYVYLIEKGSVKLGNYSTDGRILIKELIYESELMGENVFTENKNRNEFAEVMTDCRYFKIEAALFKKIINQNPAFANEIIHLIIGRMQSMEERLQSFVFKSAKTRIVDFIYRTGNRKGVKIGLDELLINHGMSHKEIAFLTDTSRQTVARVLNELKKENLIHYGSGKSSKILIRNLFGLRDYDLAV
ncbi:MAG: Crp/Fnr family transcriptional regulator [Saprospiraceae bacterium]|nr:Crp/Fnr family transcriptional regulator [Saprospiraceae bacterium]